MSQRDIQDIVRLARDGSQQAYKELIEMFGSSLLGYFYRNTGRLEDSEDLLQDLFIRVIKGLKHYDEREKFKFWIFRIAHNLLIDYWRKRKIKLESDIDESQGTFGRNISGDAPDPLSALSNKELYDKLQDALDELPASQKEVLIMRYFSGLSFEEIADINGTPVGTLLARAHRGMQKLKTKLKGITQAREQER